MHPLVLLAKKAVESYLQEGKIISPRDIVNIPEELLKKKAGVFVTITKKGQLRGCIGTYLPTKENIAQETINNAILAATKDWRFFPVTKEELPFLSYTVYVLSEPVMVKNLEELDPKKYGIIVKSSSKTGLLLPDLEGVDTVEKQISIACQKAGINPLQEKIVVFKFSAEKHQ